MRPRLTLRASGGAPAAVVWERYERLALWPTWSPQIRRVEADGELLRAGLEGRVHGPAGLAVDFAVTAVDDAARTWSWHLRTAGVGAARISVALDLDHAVLPRGPGAATTLTISGPTVAAPIVVGYAPVARLALGRLVRP